MTEAKLQPYLLTICIISAEGLNKVIPYYVTVSIDGDDQISKQITPIKEGGGNNPKWNHEMTFMFKQISVQRNLLSVVLKIHDKGSFYDKCVGEVRIPMKEMVGDNKPVDVVTFQLKKSKYHLTKPKGEIKISYQIRELVGGQLTAKSDELVIAYPDVVPVEAGSVTSAKPDELVTSSLDEAPIDNGSSYFLAGNPQAAHVTAAPAAAAYTLQTAPATANTPQAAPVTPAANTPQAAPVTAAANTPQAAPVTAAPAAACTPQAATVRTAYSSSYPQPVYPSATAFPAGNAQPAPAGYQPYQQGYGYLPQYPVSQPGYGYQPIYYPATQLVPPKKNKFGVGGALLMAASFLRLSGSSPDEILDIRPPDLWSACFC